MKVAALLIFLLCAASFGLDAEQVIYVPEDYSQIQKAIDAAPEGAVIRVAPGHYRENIDFKGKNIRLTSETYEDWDEVKKTIIDGGGEGPAVIMNGDRCFLIGFTIKNGLGIMGEFEGREIKTGGGILVTAGTSPVIAQNNILENTSHWGAGIMAREESSPYIGGNVISANEGSFGGGIFLEKPGGAWVEENTISGNIASEEGGGDGGAIYVLGGEATVYGNNLSGNLARKNGGGIAIYREASIRLEKNTLSGNTASNLGGGIFSDTPGADIKENIFNGNIAGKGGAIYLEQPPQNSIYGNELNSNRAISEGGGLYSVVGEGLLFQNNQFIANLATRGGAFFIEDEGNWEKEGNSFLGNAPGDEE